MSFNAGQGLRALMEEESGQNVVEYSLVLVFLSLGVVAALRQFPGLFLNWINNGVNFVAPYWAQQ